jgi:hypothetical protein
MSGVGTQSIALIGIWCGGSPVVWLSVLCGWLVCAGWVVLFGLAKAAVLTSGVCFSVCGAFGGVV